MLGQKSDSFYFEIQMMNINTTQHRKSKITVFARDMRAEEISILDKTSDKSRTTCRTNITQNIPTILFTH